MKKNMVLSEILLTSNHVNEESWLNLLNAISKLNGLFKKWYIYVTIEMNEVRYFLETSCLLPPVISSLGDFLIKKIEDEEIENLKYCSISKTSSFLFVTNKEKNILDILDKKETKKNLVLKVAKMRIFSYCKNHFFIKTKLFFTKGNSSKLKLKTALFNIPHLFLSIDFSIYNRFFYRKYANEYLDMQKTLPLLKSDSTNAILKVNTFPYLSEDYYLNQSNYDFDKHSIIIGSSGTGKSKLISLLIDNISKNATYSSKYKFVVIDPHASIEKDVGGLDSTSVIDFKTRQTSSDLFMDTSVKDVIASTELILSLFKSLMADQYNSKLERILRHSVHLLMEDKSLNFLNLRKLILEMEYRNSLINRYQSILPDSVTNFFLTDFNELKSKSYSEAIAPIISFIDEMQMLPVFSGTDKYVQIKDILKNHFLTIFSLDQVTLGEKITKTISGLVMQQILELIQSYTYDEHIILVVDEVSLIENPILARFLSEARKYNLSLVLIQQYFSQISEALRQSIFTNVSNYYVFRVSRSDALLLESNLHMEVAVHNSFKIRLKLLTELKNRECIVRISNNGVLLPAFKAKTANFIPIPKKMINQILNTDLLLEPLFLDESEKNMESEKKKNTSIFSIEDSVDNLIDIMKSQSSSRRRLAGHG